MVGLSLRFAFEVSQHEVGDGIEEVLQNFGTLIKPVIYGITYLYITVNTIITVALWRGQWLLLDELTNSMIGGEKKLLWYILLHAWVLCFALMIVVFLRSSISLIACPLGVASDRREEVYNAPSLHNRTLTDHTFMSFLSDIFLSLIVICLSISVWWSCWRLFDDMACFNSSLHTDGLLTSVPNQSKILWWSIILGYVFCLTVYCFQVKFHINLGKFSFQILKKVELNRLLKIIFQSFAVRLKTRTKPCLNKWRSATLVLSSVLLFSYLIGNIGMHLYLEVLLDISIMLIIML